MKRVLQAVLKKAKKVVADKVLRRATQVVAHKTNASGNNMSQR